MSNIKIKIWNREFELLVDYSCYPGEEVTDIQKDAVTNFIGNTECVSKVLDDLKKYVENNSDNTVMAGGVDNIFKYVVPKSLFVPRTERKTIALMCNFRFDIEHGIAIVFEEGKLKEIGSQDIIL